VISREREKESREIQEVFEPKSRHHPFLRPSLDTRIRWYVCSVLALLHVLLSIDASNFQVWLFLEPWCLHLGNRLCQKHQLHLGPIVAVEP